MSREQETTTSIERLLDRHESEDLEFKRARGGLPNSIWETYSAFANTHGGLIVLGVEELKDGRYALAGLSREDAEKLKHTLWREIRNKQKVNTCILSEEHVIIEEVDGSYLLLIQVPQAPKELRPIYVGTQADSGTYQRRSEGDFRCTPSEVRRMYADSALAHPADSRILRNFTWDDIDLSSVKQYRLLFAQTKPSHPWITKDDQGLMEMLGGYRSDRETGEKGFTLAGLLMFGKPESITDPDCAPHFFLDYQEQIGQDNELRWIDRICSDGSWPSNLFQFYRRVLPKLQESLPTPFILDGNQRRENTPAHEALREAFVNCCVHADYREASPLKVLRSPSCILFSNPGTMLISRSQYIKGGQSVCRNPSLQKMFMMIGAAERAGSGTDKIFKGWESIGRQRPNPQEKDNPSVVELYMPLDSLLDPKVEQALEQLLGEDTWHRLSPDERNVLYITYTEGVTNHDRIRSSLSIHRADVTLLLQHLVQEGLLSSQGHGRGTTYRLEANVDTPEANVDSSETNVDSSEANVDRPEANVDRPRTRIPFEALRSIIMEYCTDNWRSVQEIASYTGKTTSYLRNHILPKLYPHLDRQYPSESHPNQKYRTKPHED
jgi:divergent AAA domain protein